MVTSAFTAASLLIISALLFGQLSCIAWSCIPSSGSGPYEGGCSNA